MANYYVYSGAGGAATGADWANAFLSLATAMSGKTAGDIFWVAHDHAESNAAVFSCASPGTEAIPCKVYCVNRAGSVPPVEADLRTTATITVTGTFNMAMTGTVSECYGITFSGGTGATATNINVASTANRTWRFVNCVFKLGNTGSSGRINMGGAAANQTILENCQFQFGSTGQAISATGKVIWKNTPNAIIGPTYPTGLLLCATNGSFFLEGIDLSGFTGSLFAYAAFNSFITAKDCKFGSGTLNGSLISGSYGMDVIAIRCDSADTNYKAVRANYYGEQTVETTIVRTGGASDGTTPFAAKIITNTTPKWELPFEALPITIWNETIGTPITVTIQGIWGGGAVPTNKDIWIDVEYLGTSGFPLALKATSTVANGLATASNNPAGSGTWGGSTTKFAMSVTFTPQEKGPITIYVKVGLASSTFYFDPKPVIT